VLIVKHRVSIALATYNGEKYLLEQLQSFISQTYRPDEIVVFDDCSADSTLHILQSFAETAPFDVHIHVNNSNLGYVQNFSNALTYCTGDIIFLSDQDDVWLPTKIERVINRFETKPDLQLAIHDVDYCKEDLTPIGQTKIERMEGVFDLNCRYVTGMATAVRGSFLRLCLPIPYEEGVTHDDWLHRCASSVGRKAIMREVLALYRRHSANTTSSRQLNVDHVTNPNDFKEHPRSILYWLTTRTTIKGSDISLIVKWLIKNRNIIVKYGYSTALQVDKIVNEEMQRVQSARARYVILNSRRSKRFLRIIDLYKRGGYSYFGGWKSALKDLVLN
jgi:glycosyltransferase involved in cell wall biosynthesis